ncbi:MULTISPECIES: ATP-grasp domain-containing protein [unclassified Francisella]|uniref:ATP-grasp domain-containing protein n=1 Tax=unclassified Francisella TaxID=2610885 RepID=UPI002E308088|nr:MULTISPECIES: ATP-grasp domain-containing protein [unclassified Francisella]MED7820167.1 ATP-grasp domain-containing protein [Francisella sp. 19S2-4]MED7830985.1 ATP-grasp domain-containing protein [Francisella sp. 19S2-10]
MKIAISGLNNTDNPAPGIPVAKSLSNKFSLIGLSYDASEPGNYQNLFSKTYLMPYPSSGFNELKARLEYIKKKDNIQVVIPNLDAELPLYIKYQDQISKEIGINLCLPSQENFELRNKNRLDKLCCKLGIKYPKTYQVNTIAELHKTIEDLSFPLMIKGNYYKAYKVSDTNNAINAFYNIYNEWGLPILLQECIDGEEINLAGIANGKGVLKGAVAIKKLTTTDLGKVWLGLTIKNDLLMQVAQEFTKLTKWQGAFELECIVNSNGIYMIEINPRFPAWVHLATEIGINLPEMLIKIIQNESFETKLDYPINKIYVRFVDEIVADFDEYKNLVLNKETR